jgi:hypothetical protein
MNKHTTILVLILTILTALSLPAYCNTLKETDNESSATDTSKTIQPKLQGIWIATAESLNKGINYKRIKHHEFAHVSDDTVRLDEGSLFLVEKVTHDKDKDLYFITFKNKDVGWLLSEVKKNKAFWELSLINSIDGEPVEVSRIFIKVQKQGSLK